MFYGYQFSDLGWGRAFMVAGCGLVIVFMMLAILALVIMLISKVVNAIDSGRKAAAAPAAAPKKAAPPAAPAAPAAPAQDQDELVAVLMAAIAEDSNTSPDAFRITNIQAR